MSEPTTPTGKRLNLLLGECDIRWPDEYTSLAPSFWGEHLSAIEREAAAAERERLRDELKYHAGEHQCRITELLLADSED